MTIIADSGSTKTTWMDVASGNKIVTEGLNPHFTTDEHFLAVCDRVRRQFSTLHSSLSTHFYGAGCGNTAQRRRTRELLSVGFGTESVEVETDILGACRAVSADSPSLVGILGTGSNACFYDGRDIVMQAVSTGYILGDHGSANHVGRRLLQDYLTSMMPEEVCGMFHEAFPLSHDEFIESVYHKPNANRFLATLARFAVQHLDNSYCSTTVVYDSLCGWNDYQLDSIRRASGCTRLSLVGGFAANILPVLNRFAADHGLILDNVVADPIDGLREYHTIHI